MGGSMSRSPTASPGIAYQPSLDGVRAVAVTMVLLFHGQVGWMRGGYFGVSMFFTLSGFLITSLLVRESASTGRDRRRRRSSAPLAAIDAGQPAVPVGACASWAAFDVWTGVDHLRRDTLGALFQVANWVQLGGGESYMDLQRRNAGVIVSPLDHYWSLAIEEQFYWVWPLGVLGLARLARRGGWGLSWPRALLRLFAAAAHDCGGVGPRCRVLGDAGAG